MSATPRVDVRGVPFLDAPTTLAVLELRTRVRDQQAALRAYDAVTSLAQRCRLALASRQAREALAVARKDLESLLEESA